MVFFSKKKKPKKSGKSTCLYTDERLEEKAAKNMIKRAVILNGINDSSPVRAILAASAFPNTHNYAVLTDTDLAYITTNGATFRANRFPVESITSINTSNVGMFVSNIYFSVGGAGMVELDIKAIMQETDAFCELIRDRMNGASSPAAASTADEIMKFKHLLDEGVITQEEFNAKKKQLLGV